MKYILTYVVIVLMIGCLSSSTSAQYSIKTTKVDSNIYLYTSYGDAGNYKNVDANAVVLVSGDEAMLFDTPWDSM